MYLKTHENNWRGRIFIALKLNAPPKNDFAPPNFQRGCIVSKLECFFSRGVPLHPYPLYVM